MTDKKDFDLTPSASAEGWENADSDGYQTAPDYVGSLQQADEAQADEAELMLEELTHRVNNELAGLLNVATLEMLQAGEASGKAALQRLQSRLLNVSRLHKALLPWKEEAGQIDAGQYLRDLCEALQHSSLGNVPLQCSGTHCLLAAPRCRRLGMAVAELVQNAQRHGLVNGQGHVGVHLRRLNGYLCCSVADDGAGSEGLVPGRGLKIVAALVRGLGGQLQHESQGAGTTWTIAIPIHSASYGGSRGAPHGPGNVQPELSQAVCLRATDRRS